MRSAFIVSFLCGLAVCSHGVAQEVALDLHPDKATYRPGDRVTLELSLEGAPASATVEVQIYNLGERIFSRTLPAAQATTLSWTPPPEVASYGVDATLTGDDGQPLAQESTAFDMQRNWVDMPRYGFLSDFGPDEGNAADVEVLKNYHLNALQFYDWMYRHDQHMPPRPEYIDSLGRTLSLNTIRARIEQAHAVGMAAMAYTTIYAGSNPYYQGHKDQALYQPDGQPWVFGDNYLFIFDPSVGSGWRGHQLSEYRDILASLPFDGLHIDQFGLPKFAVDAKGTYLDLAPIIPSFLQAARNITREDQAVVFNLVNNWPIDTVAPEERDFTYIEVWYPNEDYGALRELVYGARKKSGGRPVVLAAYLSAEAEAGTRLLNSVIAAAGGTHLELGEGGELLADPYFPEYETPDPELTAWLENYYDFIVRYQTYLYNAEGKGVPEGARLGDMPVSTSAYPREAVWLLASQGQEFETLHLINLTAAKLPLWRFAQPEPMPVTAQELSYPVTRPVADVYLASPDGNEATLQRVDFTQQDGVVKLTVPRLDAWTMLVFDYQAGS